MSRFCPDCGNQLRDGVKFCDKCGSSVANQQPANRITLMCPQCGSALDNYYGICPFCGKVLRESDEPAFKALGIVFVAILLVVLIPVIVGFIILFSM